MHKLIPVIYLCPLCQAFCHLPLVSLTPHIHGTPGCLTAVGVRQHVSRVLKTAGQLGCSVFISTLMSKIFPDGSVRPNDSYAVSSDDIANTEDNRKASLTKLLWRPVTSVIVISLPGTNQISRAKHNCCAIETIIYFFNSTTMRCMSQHGDNLSTHWGQVTYSVSKLTGIGSDNGLSPGRRQAIIWTNAGIVLI